MAQLGSGILKLQGNLGIQAREGGGRVGWARGDVGGRDGALEVVNINSDVFPLERRENRWIERTFYH